MDGENNPYAPPDATLRPRADPYGPPRPPGIGRRIVGILVGGIGVDLILALPVTVIVIALVAVVAGENDTLIEAVATVTLLTFSVLGGYIAAYIAPWRPWLIGLLAGSASALASSPLLLFIEEPMGTLDIVSGIAHFPLAAWGGHLAPKRTPPT